MERPVASGYWYAEGRWTVHEAMENIILFGVTKQSGKHLNFMPDLVLGRHGANFSKESILRDWFHYLPNTSSTFTWNWMGWSGKVQKWQYQGYYFGKAALLDKKRKRGLCKANLQNPCAEDAIKDLITKNTGRSLENLSDAGEWQTLVAAIQQHPDLVTTIGAMATKETKNKEPKLSGLTTSTESTQPSASSSKSSLPQPNQSLSVSCETNEDSPRFRVGIGGEVRLARHSPSSTFLDEYDVFMRRADMIIASQANAIMDILGAQERTKGRYNVPCFSGISGERSGATGTEKEGKKCSF
jgi:hypothetical protein